MESLMFICMQKMNSLLFWDIVKILKTCYFEYFENAWSWLSIAIASTCSKLWNPKCLSATKKWTLFFLTYCKDIENLLLWVLWKCLIMSINNDSITLQETLILKVLKSTCRELWCLSACKKWTSSLTYFLKYCKDIANLLFYEFWERLSIPIKNNSKVRTKRYGGL